MESYVKIKSSVNEMKQKFQKTPEYYYIKSYDGEKNYKGNDDEKIIFDCLIRHDEINDHLDRKAPYTFKTLEKKLEQEINEYLEKK